MIERREPMTQSERLLLAKRAISVLPVAACIGGVATWMLGWAMHEMAVGIRVMFGLFFGGILLFIVGVHVGSAFEIEKLVRFGVVTNKRISVSHSTNSRMSPRHFLSLDAQEYSVEQWVYQQVHTGQTVELSYTAKLQNLFATRVVSDPAAELGVAGGNDSRPAASPPAHLAPLSKEGRKILVSAIGWALVWRGAGGILLAGVVWGGLLIVWVVARSGLPEIQRFDVAAINGMIPLTAVAMLAALNRQTYRLLRDFFGGQERIGVETVLDVTHSNTTLASPTIVATGPGMGGNSVWVQTDQRWTAVEPSLGVGLASGSRIEVASGPNSAVVLHIRDAVA